MGRAGMNIASVFDFVWWLPFSSRVPACMRSPKQRMWWKMAAQSMWLCKCSNEYCKHLSLPPMPERISNPNKPMCWPS
jgi:hypothetical protein